LKLAGLDHGDMGESRSSPSEKGKGGNATKKSKAPTKKNLGNKLKPGREGGKGKPNWVGGK